ncbi:sensor histidine kinase [Pseudoduganella violaceinigra]|uniref:sensor histidine kinase n=1 Tax=Pseudoduganella violaceinigra TaxID=246602 RepID=UPI000406678D|nr:ATP-binding protein [Pseudoduganella violaceinigra]
MFAHLHSLSAASRDTFWRSLKALGATRIVIALVLLAYFAAGELLSRELSVQFSIGYLLLAIALQALASRWRRHFMLQLMSQVACDLTCISLLYVVAGGMRSGLAILYLFPLAGCAILAPLVLALFSASLATLFMLAHSTYEAIAQGESLVMQAGLYGVACFSAVLLVNRMAARLIGQEELAAQRGIEVGVQQAVNRLVIAHSADGILVVRPDGAVDMSNPAAQQMLGAAAPELDAAALQPISAAYDSWRADQGQATAFVTIKPFADPELAELTAAWSARRDVPLHLKLRFAAADTTGLGVERNVIFLEDVTGIEEKAQQLKLASMGRLTASIAHEVRNPLSAIGHANSLLEEDLVEPVHKRLLKIVSDNVARVNRMVEDILKLSRKAQSHHEPLQLETFLAELKTEFDETHNLDTRIVQLAAMPGVKVRFDPLHLREVLINLLNNAVRYASGTPACIRVFIVQVDGRSLELHVQDDGPGISPQVRAHLFEPFYTTSSKGTGLGLYLARELCLNNDAMLDYEHRFEAGMTEGGARKSSGRFVITFARFA